MRFRKVLKCDPKSTKMKSTDVLKSDSQTYCNVIHKVLTCDPKVNEFINFSESSDSITGYIYVVGEFHFLLTYNESSEVQSIRTEINASMITYLGLCTAPTGRSTSLN